MGWKSCLFLLATFGVFVMMVGECMAKAGPEQVHKLPTDDHDHTKRSSDGEAVDGVQQEEDVEQGSVEGKKNFEDGKSGNENAVEQGEMHLDDGLVLKPITTAGPTGEKPEGDGHAVKPKRQNGDQPVQPGGNGDQPVQPGGNGDQPVQPGGNGDQPVQPGGNGDQPVQPGGNGDQPVQPGGNGDQPVQPGGNGDQPVQPGGNGDQPVQPGGNGDQPVQPGGNGDQPVQPGGNGDQPVQPGGETNNGQEGDKNSKIPDPLHTNFVVYYDKESGNCYFGTNGPEAKGAADANNKDKMANGKIKVQDNDALPICMADFDEMARKKSCGMPKYDQMVYCAKVQFYGEKGLEEAKKYMETNDPKTFDEFQKNFMQNNIFVFVDGCLQCDDTKTTAKATVEFWHIHPAGPIAEPKVCPEEEEKINQGMEKSFDEVAGKVSKTVPYISGTMLKERLCVSRPNMESDAMMKLSYKYKAKIVVKHNCGGVEGDEMKEHTVMFGTTIEKDKLNNNVFHLRNLKIVLDPKSKNKTETITWDWNEKKKGLGYFYYEPKGVKDSNGGIVLTQEDIEKEMNQLDIPI